MINKEDAVVGRTVWLVRIDGNELGVVEGTISGIEHIGNVIICYCHTKTQRNRMASVSDLLYYTKEDAKAHLIRDNQKKIKELVEDIVKIATL